MESLLVSGSVFVAVTTIILVFWWLFAAQKVLRERLTPSGVVAVDGAPTILRRGGPSANLSLLDEFTAALPFMPRLEHLADQAGWAGKGKVVLLSMLGLALCGGLIGGLRFGHWFGALVCAAIAGPLPIPYLQFRRAKRLEKFTEQFPEALDMITRALRTGYAVGPAFQMVTEDMPDPVAFEFRRVFEQITLGRPVTEALQDLHKRMQTEDVRFFYVAVGIQREVGGNLAEILEKLSEVIRERFKLLEFARTLSAQQKASAYCVAASPFVAALALTFGSPGWFDPLWTWKYGGLVVAGAIVWQVIGFLVLKRIANITV